MTSPKAEIFEQFAELARVLGQGNRLELLEHAILAPTRNHRR